jgi:hypothetical protein
MHLMSGEEWGSAAAGQKQGRVFAGRRNIDDADEMGFVVLRLVGMNAIGENQRGVARLQKARLAVDSHFLCAVQLQIEFHLPVKVCIEAEVLAARNADGTDVVFVEKGIAHCKIIALSEVSLSVGYHILWQKASPDL